jgi:hypothetical protein
MPHYIFRPRPDFKNSILDDILAGDVGFFTAGVL